MNITVYVLLSSTGEYYVGVTRDFVRRLQEHTDRVGSIHTKRWPSFEVIETNGYDVTDWSSALDLERDRVFILRSTLPGRVIWGPGEDRLPNLPHPTRKKKPGVTCQII